MLNRWSMVIAVCANNVPVYARCQHYSDVIMSPMASRITSVSIDCSTVCSDADQRKHQSSASPVSVRGIHRSPVNTPHKWSVTRKMFPYDDVIMRGVNPSVDNANQGFSSVTKGYSVRVKPIKPGVFHNEFNYQICKFELNPISGLSANTRKLLDQSEVRKRWGFSGAWSNVNQAHNE